MAKVKENKQNSVVIGRQEDGTVQLTFTVPWSDVLREREEVVREMALSIVIPGFRKGKAPLDKAREKLDPQKVVKDTLSRILPKELSRAIRENNIVPAIYPKFELLEAKEGKDWQIRAVTAELPVVDVSGYEKHVKDAKPADFWIPGKGEKDKKELTQEEKENIVIGALTDNYKFIIPKVLIEEEVNGRLSSLLDKIEKLGLSLEGYLSSTKKTVEGLRSEYRTSSENAIRLDVLLGRIAEAENITAREEEINEFIKMANAANPSQRISDEQKNTIGAFLVKRKVLDRLVLLIA